MNAMNEDTKSELTINNQLSYGEIYFVIWEGEQEHTRTRWTIVTFFLSVSFAIFGFSLQVQQSPIPISTVHIAALAIYWFAYLLFSRFNKYNIIIRIYLREMEESGKVSIDLQRRTDKIMRGRYSRLLSASALLFGFGILYSVAVVLLWLFS
jgi:hypothetical protein